MSRPTLALLTAAPVTLALVLACAGGATTPGAAPDEASGTTIWTSSGASFKGWTMPGDVRTRLDRAGWTVADDDCSADEDGDLFCFAAKGDDVARVVWFDYEGSLNAMANWKDELDHGEIGERDGAVVLSVRVADNPASLAAAQVLMADKVDLTTQDQAAIRARLEAAGYGQIECEADDDTQDQCTGVKGDERVRLTVGREPDPESVVWEFDTDADNGGAYLYDETGWAKATVFSAERGAALMGVLLAE